MKVKIIIADDDPGIRDLFKIIFEKAGYETTMFADGGPLLKNQYELPDIFLLDNQLPGADGMEICRHIKKRRQTKDIPVIMVSASPDLGKLAKEAGADDFIEKPFSNYILLEKVNKAIQKKIPAE